MGQPVIEQVLGNNSFYADTYIKETIQFVKSIVFVNHNEAKSYNDLIQKLYPSHVIPEQTKNWRYYKHLMGEYYVLDKTVKAVSVDNGTEIEITRANLNVHRKTRNEILKFGLYYDQLVKKFPEQELYIRMVTLDPLFTAVEEILTLEDYTLVACNKVYIEENEDDLLKDLQTRINHHKHIWLIPYYALVDNLFLASQYHIFYNFLLTSILAIRLQNDKTMRAHSFHIRMYFASHHGLDKHLLFLTKKQQLFLYRNMLYLNNHSGKNHVFQKLIDVLFTERNISVVNYIFHQKGTFDLARRVEYAYNQKLLNSKPLAYYPRDYSLMELGSKEIPLAPGNKDEYAYKYDQIDLTNKYSLYSKLLTKDLETILMDETDSVRYKLLDILTDYWAYLAKNNLVNFLTEVVDPVTNVSTRMSAKDLFKFYVICLYAKSGYQIDEFPDYRIKRVFRPTQPTPAQIQKLFYERRFEYTKYIEDVQTHIPGYTNLLTSFQFSEYITQIYRLNIGLWTLLANYGDMETEGQMRMAIDTMHQTELYSFNDETVTEFLGRVGISDPREYNQDVLTGYIFNILDTIFDNRLSFLNRLQKLQRALTDIFFNFNSYTVQLINNYYSGGHILAGIKDRRYSWNYRVAVNMDVNMGGNDILLIDHYEPTGKTKNVEDVTFNFEFVHWCIYRNTANVTIPVGIYVEPTEKQEYNVYFNTLVLTEAEGIVKTSADSEIDLAPEVIEHFYRTKSMTEIDLHADIFVGDKTKHQITKLLNMGVHFEVTHSSPPDPSSDEILRFLALNS